MNGPFIHTKNTSFKIMKNILIALIPLILFAIYKNGIVLFFKGNASFLDSIYPLFLILICSLSTFTFDTLYTLIFCKDKMDIKEYIRNSFSFIPGIILSLVIPINTPIFVIIISCLISTILGKLLFGISNKYLFNTVALSFLIISIFSLINGGYSYLNSYENTKYTSTPLQAEISNGLNYSYEETVKPYGSLKQFFVGNVPGGIGEVSILICIISFIYLIVKKSIKYLIPISILVTLLIGFTVGGLINNFDGYFALFNIFTGGIIFSSIFISSSMFTSPITSKGQIIYGILIGILTLIFRFIIPFGDIFLATLICNLLVPLIDNICIRLNR